MRYQETIYAPIVGEVRELVDRGFMLPPGIANANPGLLKPDKRFRWAGEVTDRDEKLARFETPGSGIRAMTIKLNYFAGHADTRTLQSVALEQCGYRSGLALPLREYLSAQLGFPGDEPISFHALRLEIVSAIIAYENRATFKGQKVETYYEQRYIARAVALASHI